MIKIVAALSLLAVSCGAHSTKKSFNSAELEPHSVSSHNPKLKRKVQHAKPKAKQFHTHTSGTARNRQFTARNSSNINANIHTGSQRALNCAKFTRVSACKDVPDTKQCESFCTKHIIRTYRCEIRDGKCQNSGKSGGGSYRCNAWTCPRTDEIKLNQIRFDGAITPSDFWTQQCRAEREGERPYTILSQQASGMSLAIMDPHNDDQGFQGSLTAILCNAPSCTTFYGLTAGHTMIKNEENNTDIMLGQDLYHSGTLSRNIKVGKYSEGKAYVPPEFKANETPPEKDYAVYKMNPAFSHTCQLWRDVHGVLSVEHVEQMRRDGVFERDNEIRYEFFGMRSCKVESVISTETDLGEGVTLSEKVFLGGKGEGRGRGLGKEGDSGALVLIHIPDHIDNLPAGVVSDKWYAFGLYTGIFYSDRWGGAAKIVSLAHVLADVNEHGPFGRLQVCMAT